MTVRYGKTIEAKLLERVAHVIIESAWANRNRAEAQAVASATARKLVAEVLDTLARESVRQIAPATFEVA